MFSNIRLNTLPHQKINGSISLCSRPQQNSELGLITFSRRLTAASITHSTDWFQCSIIQKITVSLIITSATILFRHKVIFFFAGTINLSTSNVNFLLAFSQLTPWPATAGKAATSIVKLMVLFYCSASVSCFDSKPTKTYFLSLHFPGDSNFVVAYFFFFKPSTGCLRDSSRSTCSTRIMIWVGKTLF